MSQTVQPAVDGAVLRAVMGSFTTGVAIVTARHDGADHGMTVNSLTSVSLDPPLVLVCLASDSRTAQAVRSAPAFAVNLLSRDQMTLSNRFARQGLDHFEELVVERADGDIPILLGGLGYLVCGVRDVHPGGDHLVVIGEVRRCCARDGEPLVFYRGRYVRQANHDSQPAPSWWA